MLIPVEGELTFVSRIPGEQSWVSQAEASLPNATLGLTVEATTSNLPSIVHPLPERRGDNLGALIKVCLFDSASSSYRADQVFRYTTTFRTEMRRPTLSPVSYRRLRFRMEIKKIPAWCRQYTSFLRLRPLIPLPSQHPSILVILFAMSALRLSSTFPRHSNQPTWWPQSTSYSSSFRHQPLALPYSRRLAP